VDLIPLEHSLRQLFHEVVSECYDSHLGLRDAEISSYVADLLTEFCHAENVYRIRDAAGNPVREVGEMLLAADPVHGTASSFGEERERRKHIGDYTLFFTGMYPESMHRWGERQRESFFEMVQAGKESYYIVSQFDLFEYAQEAPFSRAFPVPSRPASTGSIWCAGSSTAEKRSRPRDSPRPPARPSRSCEH
jgi:hypothetical protein